jgi:hypothetical protein
MGLMLRCAAGIAAASIGLGAGSASFAASLKRTPAVAKGTGRVTARGDGPHEISGALAHGQGSAYPKARCSGNEPYVKRGRDETVPLFNAWLEWPAGIFGWIANDTVPYKFGSRAVTSYTVVISRAVNSDERRAEWRLKWSCTSDKDNAYLVFGF